MTKSRPSKSPKSSQSASPETTEDRLRARLDEEDAGSETALHAQVAFWSQLRTALAVNDASLDLPALNELALSIMADDDAAPAALAETVMLLSSLDSMHPGQAPQHGLFLTVPAAFRSSKRPSTHSTSSPPSPPVKKQRTAKAKQPTTGFQCQLPDDTPARIKKDLQ